ncbi:universal stress protein UspF [Entomohabitans teleogrylli]|uniref:universal stress protein UspF n=1 Tax=Entomohabitans teleogrylli TaxID=1384589 RepID=UPI00073D9EAA|nr:universal stress protein UspF [Entomohabitans teleogrylli]
MYRTILVPIDISDAALNEQVTSHVELQAGLENSARVHFLTVIPTFPYYAAMGLGYSGEKPDKEKFRTEALAQLDEIIKKFNLTPEQTEKHIVSGSPKDEILKLADVIHADLIIIASHRPGISTYLLGSNAAAVVRHAKCSVLVAR